MTPRCRDLGAISEARWSREARPPRGTATALALVAYSMVTNRRESSHGRYVARNVGACVALLAAARRQGLGWDELGLGPAHATRGLGLGVRAATIGAVATAAATVVAAGHPAGRRLLTDRRAAIDRRDLARQVLARIPIGTAACEELAFRGVLLGMVTDRHRPWTGVVASSATFGLWHIGPTLAALRANGVASGRARACATSVVVTSVAGFAFAALRVAGGHVLTPTLVHWAVNAVALAAAAEWQRAVGSVAADDDRGSYPDGAASA